MGLIIVAGYESDLRMRTVEAKRRLQTVQILGAVAALVFAYDALSVLVGS